MNKILIYLRLHIGKKLRKNKNFFDRQKWKIYNGNSKKHPTIISQNCTGGVMSHDLGLQFTSPTINLFMESKDYIKFLENLEYYLSIDANLIEFIQDSPYPVGYLEDIKIYFVHYNSEEEVIEKWNIRKSRVDMNNLFIIMTDRDGCTDEIFNRFINLSFKNKIFYSHSKKDNNCVIYMPCFKHENQVGGLTDFCNILGKRYYAKYFDYIKWLSKKQ